MKRKSLYVLVVLVFAVMAGCAGSTFTRDAYRGLSVSAITYEACMGSAAQLYVNGQIDDAQKAKVIEIARGYWLAYHCAVDALVAYDVSKDATDREKVHTAIAEVSQALSKLVKYLTPHVEEA